MARKSAGGGWVLSVEGSDFLDFFFGSFLLYQDGVPNKRNEQPSTTDDF